MINEYKILYNFFAQYLMVINQLNCCTINIKLTCIRTCIVSTAQGKIQIFLSFPARPKREASGISLLNLHMYIIIVQL